MTLGSRLNACTDWVCKLIGAKIQLSCIKVITELHGQELACLMSAQIGDTNSSANTW